MTEYPTIDELRSAGYDVTRSLDGPYFELKCDGRPERSYAPQEATLWSVARYMHRMAMLGRLG